MNYQYKKRFGGIGRLFGREGLERLHAAHVCVIGAGGVGSWAVEALARSGVGTLTLVDMDDVCISNVNRQLPALDGELGRPKVEVLERRVKAINPECTVHALQAFFLRSNAEEILKAPFQVVIDAIDVVSVKALMIAMCRARNLPLVTVGGAGGRRDPTAIKVTDLAFSSHDRLLQQVRRTLRQEHGFPRRDQPFGIEAVFSREEPVFPTAEGCVTSDRSASTDLRLDCSTGFGTATFVTGTFGFVAASRAIELIANSAPNRPAAPDSKVVGI